MSEFKLYVLDQKDLNAVLANIDGQLYECQKRHEQYVGQESSARDLLTDARLKYEFKVADFIKDNKKEGTVTILRELALCECKEEYTAFVKAESDLKKVQAGKDMYAERLNTLKKLKDGNSPRGMR